MKVAFGFVLLTLAKSAKILGIFNLALYSHFAPGQKLMNALVDSGHDVTVIACYNHFASKFKLVHLTGFEEEMKDLTRYLHGLKSTTSFQTIKALHFLGDTHTRKTFGHPNVQALLNSNQTFDVVLIESFVNEAFLGLCHHFKSGCVVYSTTSSNYWLNTIVGNPDNPSYIPQRFLREAAPLDFWARLLNAILFTIETVYFNTIIVPEQNAIMRKYLPSVPNLNVLFQETDLIFLNSHASFTDAVPHVPNMVEIGGFHVKPATKLPRDVKEFLDRSDDGVILFSMGSMLKCSEMPVEKRKALIEAFSQLRQRVLWKSDIEMEDLPRNVITLKWVPQMDVLAHPNVKLFITHGGVFSVIEAVYYGVPVIGIPVFFDQPFNVMRSKNAGFGAVLDYDELTVDNILRTIRTVLGNPAYSENVKKRSQLIQDRAMKPMDTFVYWIEYVLRHRGSKHLKSAAVDLTWYQYLLLDIVASFAIAICLSCLAILWCVRRLRRLLRNNYRL